MRGTIGRLSYSNIMSTTAFALALCGTAWAVTANSIGTKQIKPGAIKNSDLAANAVGTKKVADGSLLAGDFAKDQLPVGAQGPPGPAGPPGEDGSQITSEQAMGKVKEADGSGSGLDADTVDGVSAGRLGRVYTFHEELMSSSAGWGSSVELPFLPLSASNDYNESLDFYCHEGGGNPAELMLNSRPKTTDSPPRTLNAMTHTDGVETPGPSSGTWRTLHNGAQRIGVLANETHGASLQLRDDSGGAGSEIQLIVKRGSGPDAVTATATLHAFVFNGPGDEDAFCELSGSIVRGPHVDIPASKYPPTNPNWG